MGKHVSVSFVLITSFLFSPMDVNGILSWEDTVLILSCRVDYMQLKVLKQKFSERAQI